jgi:hypothetical protein
VEETVAPVVGVTEWECPVELAYRGKALLEVLVLPQVLLATLALAEAAVQAVPESTLQTTPLRTNLARLELGCSLLLQAQLLGMPKVVQALGSTIEVLIIKILAVTFLAELLE